MSISKFESNIPKECNFIFLATSTHEGEMILFFHSVCGIIGYVRGPMKESSSHPFTFNYVSY